MPGFRAATTAMTDASALFGVFVVLKTLNALSMALPHGSQPRHPIGSAA
jgi:hypothetical protein